MRSVDYYVPASIIEWQQTIERGDTKMSEELNGSSVQSAEEAQAAQDAINSELEEPELTLDDLFQSTIDEEETKAAERELLLPVGTYTTVPPFSPTVGKDKTGRPQVRLWGTVQLGDVTGKIGFRLSWVRRNAVDFETGAETDKPDRSYKNYIMAAKAFRAAYGQDPSNVGELITYLRDFPIRLRIIQTSDGENMPVTISAVRAS